MPKKQKKDSKNYEDDEEIIIGYNNNKKKSNKKEGKKKDNPPKTKKEVTKKKKKKKSKKKRKKINIKKILLAFLKIVITLGVAAGIILFLFVSPVFNIEEVTISGAEEISESVYIAMSGIEIGENIFSIDKTKAITEIKQEAYVESVEIKSIYPRKIEINVVERKISYIAEQNGEYTYLDKNGYVLEKKISPIDMPLIKGCMTNLQNVEIGSRIQEADLEKFNDLVKIMDAIENNNITAKLSSIDITDSSNYILEFGEEKKNIMLGDSSDLSAKMAWINLFMQDKKDESGKIYLNSDNIYFSPES